MRIKINGEEIYYRRQGKGKTFLLLHGNMSSSLFFKRTMEEIDDFDFVAPDMRGFGNSSYRQKSDRIEDYVSDMKELILYLDLQHFHILGWSFGGGVVMKLLEDREMASRIDEVVFLSSMGNVGITKARRDEDYFNFLLPLHKMSLYEPSSMKGFFNSMNLPFAKEWTSKIPFFWKELEFYSKEEIEKRLIENVFRKYLYDRKLPSKTEYDRNIKEALKQRNFYEVNQMIGHFSEKTKKLPQKIYHILHGTEDIVIRPEIAKHLAAELRGKLILFPYCGHSLMTDDFEHYRLYLDKLRRSL
ncbi:MAG: alpha/beta hydrolase [Tissierellia bacterium]|nr:alpha/beta hydrolase [Tissierellia bacterium]